MSLGEYERKRSFDATPEPAAQQQRDETDGPPRFVIQEHSARRLHWDLRLEHQGALASWALPRGLPDDPGQDRLAVRTEDHPIEYLDFEGTIPEGSYGAGEMRIVDRGHYLAEKFTDAKVVLALKGERVKGSYSIFRTGGRDWLIHRMDPPDPDREPLPETLEPMRASEAEALPDSGAWAYEIDWGGERAIGRLWGGSLTLPTGGGIEDLVPEVGRVARQAGIRDVLLDGELTVLDRAGRPSRERLERRLQPGSKGTAKRRGERDPVTYVVYDLLHLDGASLLDLPWEERRRRLEELGLEGPAWRTSSVHRGDGETLLAAAAAQGLDAVIAKRVDSRYEPGVRAGHWLRVPVPG